MLDDFWNLFRFSWRVTESAGLDGSLNETAERRSLEVISVGRSLMKDRKSKPRIVPWGT